MMFSVYFYNQSEKGKRDHINFIYSLKGMMIAMICTHSCRIFDSIQLNSKKENPKHIYHSKLSEEN